MFWADELNININNEVIIQKAINSSACRPNRERPVKKKYIYKQEADYTRKLNTGA